MAEDKWVKMSGLLAEYIDDLLRGDREAAELFKEGLEDLLSSAREIRGHRWYDDSAWARLASAVLSTFRLTGEAVEYVDAAVFAEPPSMYDIEKFMDYPADNVEGLFVAEAKFKPRINKVIYVDGGNRVEIEFPDIPSQAPRRAAYIQVSGKPGGHDWPAFCRLIHKATGGRVECTPVGDGAYLSLTGNVSDQAVSKAVALAAEAARLSTVEPMSPAEKELIAHDKLWRL